MAWKSKDRSKVLDSCIQIRVTTAQRERWEKAAESEDLSIAAWMRNVLDASCALREEGTGDRHQSNP